MLSHIFSYVLLPVIEYGQNIKNKIDEAILGKMVEVSVANLADADKEQWHVVTLARSFKTFVLHMQVVHKISHMEQGQGKLSRHKHTDSEAKGGGAITSELHTIWKPHCKGHV